MSDRPFSATFDAHDRSTASSSFQASSSLYRVPHSSADGLGASSLRSNRSTAITRMRGFLFLAWDCLRHTIWPSRAKVVVTCTLRTSSPVVSVCKFYLSRSVGPPTGTPFRRLLDNHPRAPIRMGVPSPYAAVRVPRFWLRGGR
ncbi:hypothetical protein FA13DRAFT_1729384 [Coprinellus micaceus]|uniref:Uncharacterized protein n=1 Tax=Coprinellus micaceus TaxID=71717 RepID=A0A4Y7TL98_COPMI|nr:hypothetical protein FA13DRAFT_1729384 [Coprinellus micaceus]